MTRTGALILAGLALAGCATAPRKVAGCAAGQAELRTAQLFLTAPPPARLSDEEVRRFVEQEVTPRFPRGVTVMDSPGPAKASDALLVRDAPKMLMIVLPPKGDSYAAVEAVRTAYRGRFRQESVVVVPPPSCMAN
ncbi:MAG: hypothetical protein DI570_08175 [Phenylobacterium zucineum]|nr:MAG: hypothetical protein DI570_08175 [Phenylobacterium zucineum]